MVGFTSGGVNGAPWGCGALLFMSSWLVSPLKAATRAGHPGEEIEMEKGDCLYFFGKIPHELRSLGVVRRRGASCAKT